jgi:hypothetical protein
MDAAFHVSPGGRGGAHKKFSMTCVVKFMIRIVSTAADLR